MKKEDGIYIKDSLANIGEYAKLGPHFAKAIEFLQRKDLMRLPNGRYELDGENAYAMVQEATLKAWGTGRPEVHTRTSISSCRFPARRRSESGVSIRRRRASSARRRTSVSMMCRSNR